MRSFIRNLQVCCYVGQIKQYMYLHDCDVLIALSLEPWSLSLAERIACYQWIEGRPPTSEEIQRLAGQNPENQLNSSTENFCT